MMLPSHLRLALLHLAPISGAFEHNRQLIERGIQRAAALGATWVITVELVASGYCFVDVAGTDWIEPQPDAWLQGISQTIQDYGITAFIGQPERDPATGMLYNSLFVVSEKGILARHRKLHPTPGIETWASPGQRTLPCDVSATRVGLLICADAYSDAPAKELRLRGAEVLVSAAAWWPGDWGPSGEWERVTMDTRVPLIVCNRTGVDGPYDSRRAESAIVDCGRRLKTLHSDESAIFLVDLLFGDGHIVDLNVIAESLADG